MTIETLPSPTPSLDIPDAPKVNDVENEDDSIEKKVENMTLEPAKPPSCVRMESLEGSVVGALDWGLPGMLTKEEVEVFEKFRDEVESRGGEFRKTVYSFGEEEGEPHALCRWLRARKFNYDDVVQMVNEATEVRSVPMKDNFYPDPKSALNVEPHVYISQYPQLYHGNGKNGVPVFISKPGLININGMECITTLDAILRYHWYEMMHNFSNRLRANKEENENFTNFACIIVMDLAHLSTSQLNSRTMSIIKEQSKIDSLCFPETLSKMVIINAPRFFSMSWKIIKGWIDARTANKIEIISSRKAWEKRLCEIVDSDQLPSDYGGTALDTESILASNAPGNMKRSHTELLSVRSYANATVELKAGEKMNVVVYTKAKGGAKCSITQTDTKKVHVKDVVVTYKGSENYDNEPPEEAVIGSDLAGPGKFKIKVESKTKSMSKMSYDNYLVVCNIFAL